MKEAITVLVGGDTGYGGGEVVKRLKDHHPHVEEVIGFSRTFPDEEELARADAAILTFPSGVAAENAARLHDAGVWLTDVSGDLRFSTPEEYQRWYKHAHSAPQLLDEEIPRVVSELDADTEKIASSRMAAVFGCFATAAILGTEPLTRAGLIEPGETIRINAISGVSGMGKHRKAEADEIIRRKEIKIYKPGRQHQHVPEIERRVGQKVFFVPSVGPYFRGIVAHIDMKLKRNQYDYNAHEVLEEAYADHPHMTVRSLGEDLPTKTDTAGTDNCHIGLAADNRELHAAVSICNLGRGASAGGIMALNQRFGFPLMAGLQLEASDELKTS